MDDYLIPRKLCIYIGFNCFLWPKESSSEMIYSIISWYFKLALHKTNFKRAVHNWCMHTLFCCVGWSFIALQSIWRSNFVNSCRWGRVKIYVHRITIFEFSIQIDLVTNIYGITCVDFTDKYIQFWLIENKRIKFYYLKCSSRHVNVSRQ